MNLEVLNKVLKFHKKFVDMLIEVDPCHLVIPIDWADNYRVTFYNDNSLQNGIRNEPFLFNEFTRAWFPINGDEKDFEDLLGGYYQRVYKRCRKKLRSYGLEFEGFNNVDKDVPVIKICREMVTYAVERITKEVLDAQD